MKIYNQEKSQILNEYDLEKGYLKEDTITINHPEVQAIEEEFHYETIAEYPNGGKDVRKVIDVQGVKYQPARVETEDIYVYVPYTAEELQKMANEQELVELKEWFDIFYAQHEQKYRRLYTLNKQTDEGEDPHAKLLELYAEAEIKRARIQEIERLLEE